MAPRTAPSVLLLLLLLAPTALFTGIARAAAEEDAAPPADDAGAGPEEAEEDVTGEEPVQLGEHQDAEFIVVWPEGNPTSEVPKFQAGKSGSALIGFSNIGDNPFVVTSVTGSLRYPQDYNQVVQNFTTLSPTGSVVEANQHGSYLYTFTPSAKFDQSRDLTLSITINYQDGSEGTFRSTVFNSTVTIDEASSEFDLPQLLTYGFVLIGVAMFLLNNTGAGKVAKKKAKAATTAKKAKVETGTKSSAENEWLKGTHATPKKGKKE